MKPIMQTIQPMWVWVLQFFLKNKPIGWEFSAIIGAWQITETWEGKPYERGHGLPDKRARTAHQRDRTAHKRARMVHKRARTAHGQGGRFGVAAFGSSFKKKELMTTTSCFLLPCMLNRCVLHWQSLLEHASWWNRVQVHRIIVVLLLATPIIIVIVQGIGHITGKQGYHRIIHNHNHVYWNRSKTGTSNWKWKIKEQESRRKQGSDTHINMDETSQWNIDTEEIKSTN